MNVRKRAVLAVAALVLALSAVVYAILGRSPGFLDVRGPYLGQAPPGTQAKLFAPSVVPHDLHSATVFDPDGQSVYWKEMDANRFSVSERVGNRWTQPRVVSLGMPWFGLDDPCFSPDGQRLFFTSWRPVRWYRPLPHKERIWYVEKQPRGWSRPRPVGDAVNAMSLHWQLSVASSGAIYFTSEGDIYRSSLDRGQYGVPERLADAVNSEYREGTPYIAPDESYLVFSSNRHEENQGTYDLYVSYRLADGSWSEADNLGPTVNSTAQEMCPSVSPDGQYLFFLRNAETSRVYWIDSQIIQQE